MALKRPVTFTGLFPKVTKGVWRMVWWGMINKILRKLRIFALRPRYKYTNNM
jgi:hypothetical protein